MSMYTALSGISAAQTDIAATSHNIANVATAGFKSSRAEFADIYSSSPMAVARTSVGSGVQVSRTAQNFNQGNVTATGNVLDLAIEGAGFFAIRTAVGNTTETQYTRAGAFSRSVDGTIVNAAGSALLGWPVAQDGSPLSTDPKDGFPVVVPPTRGAPVPTGKIELGLNFPAGDDMIGGQVGIPPTALEFSPNDPTSYAFSTPMTILSEEGAPLNVKAYFIKTDFPDPADPGATWEARLTLDGNILPAAPPATVRFNMAGYPETVTAGSFEILGRPVTLDLGSSRVTEKAFRVETARHDGATPAALYSLEIDAAGTVYGSYSNGETVALAKIFLANFPNPQGLRQMGATALALTPQSGQPLLGSPGETGFGLLRSGALERSNVELTQELVNLITAQRNYQASAKAMETSSSLSQTIINMRS